MTVIKHRFLNHEINPETETLIIGTFNPDTPGNEADFFYGRQRNFLWRLIPTALSGNDLKGKPKNEKLEFIKLNKIDFIDLITLVNVDEGEEENYDGIYIDSREIEWRDVIGEIRKLKKLKRIAFTRKTLSGIPQMRKRIEAIVEYCNENQIPFHFLKTPARTYSDDKQKIWTDFFAK
jgi:G:T/U-mismatch repair DNA glycosylase